MPVQLPGFDMKKSQIFVKRVWQGVFALITICFLWCFINLSILAFSWLKSYSMTVDNTPQTYYADIRHDKGQVGKTLIISAIKAQPDKKVWFGHIWVDGIKPRHMPMVKKRPVFMRHQNHKRHAP